MSGRRTAWMAATLVCALSGCGTIGNLSDPGRTKPFGGVIRDADASSWLMNEASKASEKPVAEKAGLVLAAPIVTVDLPLSLIGDTMTLPFTIPVALSRQGQPSPAPSLPQPAPPPPSQPAPPPRDADAPRDSEVISSFVPATR